MTFKTYYRLLYKKTIIENEKKKLFCFWLFVLEEIPSVSSQARALHSNYTISKT